MTTPVNKMITDLPTVSNAQLGDIINAVTGYVPNSSLGTSVQQTLQQIVNLCLTNLVLNNAGNPNGVLAGNLYQFCWNTSGQQLYICTVAGISSVAVWTLITSSNFSWINVTNTSVDMVTEKGYITNSNSLISLLLPISSNVGDQIAVVGKGSGGWTITQGTGQNISLASGNTTTGPSGSLSASKPNDSIQLICTVANTSWTSLGSPQGDLIIV